MKWTKAYIASLPDSCFARVAPSGKKDKDGNAIESLREYPYKDADGIVDIPLLRTALSRLPTIEGLTSEQQDAIRTKLETELDETMKSIGRFEFLSSAIELAEGEVTSTIELLRVGIIRDRGFEVTLKMLKDYERNFKNGAYGTDLQVNLGHWTQGEAAGWFKDVFVEDDKLMGTIEWTVLGVEKIRNKLYRFISVELAGRYPTEDGKIAENVLTGAGLTNTPALKKQVPISLSEQQKTLIHNTHMFKEYLKNLKKRAKLAAEDITLARQLLSAESTDEQTALKGDVDELETKLQEQEAAEKKEREALASKGTVTLEMVNELKESNRKLAEQIALSEITKDVSNSLVLSEKNEVGFLDEDAPAVVKFMQSLSDAQRTEFKGLVAKVKAVDFNVRGTTSGVKKEGNGGKSYDERVAVRAQAIFDEAKGKTSMRDAQDQALSEIKE